MEPNVIARIVHTLLDDMKDHGRVSEVLNGMKEEEFFEFRVLLVKKAETVFLHATGLDHVASVKRRSVKR